KLQLDVVERCEISAGDRVGLADFSKFDAVDMVLSIGHDVHDLAVCGQKQVWWRDAGQSGTFFQEVRSMGIKTPNVNDRRGRMTPRMLHEAFISLILERGYDAVTIRDVVERAGVGRSTFYTHFGELDDVLVAWPPGHGWLRGFAGDSPS